MAQPTCGETAPMTCTSQQKYLYVVFSHTPCKVGKFIRWATHNTYNHVSISTEADLRTLYSFARHYCNTPLYAGFVQETRMRFCNNGKVARVKICAIPVTYEKWSETQDILQRMLASSKSYVYNFFSAALYPTGKRFRLPHSYTCVEFVSELLQDAHVCKSLESDKNYSIVELEQALAPYEIYTGAFPHPDQSAPRIKDHFGRRQGWRTALLLSLFANLELLRLILKYKIL